mmetsp:Transcript_68340/g.113623  ORF Transcript_68340/g.113623 Transcript_68340/m.113623 type:complete len:96 (+) Transcript_68340:145-432(+)
MTSRQPRHRNGLLKAPTHAALSMRSPEGHAVSEYCGASILHEEPPSFGLRSSDDEPKYVPSKQVELTQVESNVGVSAAREERDGGGLEARGVELK